MVNAVVRSEEHTSELQSRVELVCRLLLEKKNVHDRVTFQQDNVSKELPGSYDVITTFVVIHDAPDPIGLLRTIRRALSLFFFNVTPTTEIYTLSLHDALPISPAPLERAFYGYPLHRAVRDRLAIVERSEEHTSELQSRVDLVCRLLLEKT